eukprot:7249239-Prymnesium_polylepis.1
MRVDAYREKKTRERDDDRPARDGKLMTQDPGQGKGNQDIHVSRNWCISGEEDADLQRTDI